MNPLNNTYIYEIQLEGIIPEKWSGWFEELTIQHPSKDRTLLRGMLADQAALLGLLSKIHSMNLKIITVTQLPTDT